MTNKKLAVLAVEDCQTDAVMVKTVLRKEGFDVTLVNDGQAALSKLQERTFDLVVLDFVLPDLNTDELLARMKASQIKTPFVIVTGSGNEAVAVEMMKQGAVDYIVKDPGYPHLLGSVIQAYQRRRNVNMWKSRLSWALLAFSLLIICGAFRYANSLEQDAAHRQYRDSVLFDLLAATNQCIIVLDPQGHIVEWGPAATRLFGWQWDEVKGSKPDFMMPKDLWEKHAEAFMRNEAKSAGVVHIECWAYRKSGERLPITISVTSFENQIGWYHMVIISERSLTKQIKMLDMPQGEPSEKPHPVEGTRHLLIIN